MKRPGIASRSVPSKRLTDSGSLSSPPPAFFRQTTGAGQPRLRSIPAMGKALSFPTVESSDGRSRPIIWAKIGRLVSFSMIERRM